MSLHAKLAEVMAEAGRIPKNGTAPAAMGGYKFVQVGDAADAIRTALASRGVSMLPSAVEIMAEAEHETSRGGTMTTLTVRTTWTLTDSETGEHAVIQSLGTGADSGDKASPKAQTNAMKYALLMGFLLSTGDDPEASALESRGRRVSQAAPRPAPQPTNPDGTVTFAGTVKRGTGNGMDMLMRQGPDGPSFGFKVTECDGLGRGSTGVRAFGAAAIALAAHADTLEGQRLTMSGHVRGEKFTKDGKDVKYDVIVLATADGPDFTFPPDAPSDGTAPVSGDPGPSSADLQELDALPW